jgi:hypothetical protein
MFLFVPVDILFVYYPVTECRVCTAGERDVVGRSSRLLMSEISFLAFFSIDLFIPGTYMLGGLLFSWPSPNAISATSIFYIMYYIALYRSFILYLLNVYLTYIIVDMV